MNEEIFFKKYNIKSFDSLEELPFKFRDASKHFYHKTTDRVYSKNIFDYTWYVSEFAESLKFRHTQPEAYAKKIEEDNKKYALEKKKEFDFQAQFLSVDEIVTKYKDESGNVILTSQFINEIIANHRYNPCVAVVSRHRKRVGMVVLDAMDRARNPDYKKKEELSDHTTVHIHPPTRLVDFDFCWDFEYEGEGDLYLDLNGREFRVGSDLILTTGTGIRAFTNIIFVLKENNRFVPLKGNVKFKGIVAADLKDRLRNSRVICRTEYGTLLTQNATIFF